MKSLGGLLATSDLGIAFLVAPRSALRLTSLPCSKLSAYFDNSMSWSRANTRFLKRKGKDVSVYLGRPYPLNEEMSAEQVQMVVRTFAEHTNTIDDSDDEESDDIQSRAIKKLCFVADPRYESLSVRLGVSPDAVGHCRRELGLLPQHCTTQEAINLLSIAVGVIAGRWDIRIVSGLTPARFLDVFDASPPCAPAMLQDETGMPATSAPGGYPIRVGWKRHYC